MTKYLFVILCLVLSVSSYSAQFTDNPDRPSFELRFPFPDSQQPLTLTSFDKKIPLDQLKDKLKNDYLNIHTKTLPMGEQNFGGPMSDLFSPLIQELFHGVMNYLKSSLAPLFPSQFRTVTTTEERTTHFSCTVSTTACARRNRRDVIKQLLEKQTALPLSDSILSNGPAPDKFKLSDDDEKKAFSEYANNPSLYDGLSYFDPRKNSDGPAPDKVDLNDDKKANDNLSYFDPELLEGSMMDPVVATSLKENNSLVHLINMQQLPPNQAATLLSRLGLNTITITITNYASLTHTSFPVCSSQGTVSQCPN